tara:strand:- start:216 stop:620 length:405 start_codon:yes stop_codon:yes gene_type:complete
MAGSDPTGVKPNAFVEANGLAREVIERRFRLSPRTIGLFAAFGVFVPALIYRGAVKDFVRASLENARARRRSRLSSRLVARARRLARARALGTPRVRARNPRETRRRLTDRRVRLSRAQDANDARYGRDRKKFL